MLNKKMNDNKETEKSCHYERSEVMAMGEVTNTSPQPSPRGEGAVVGEHKASHTNSGEVKKAAFTLAETMIVLVVLGIVAALTIPSLVRNQAETANRTKLKKAMATYEKAINHMLIDNELETESAFKAWAKRDAQNGYTEERSYFKIAQESTSYPNCRFKTGDGIWWDICGTNDSNIEKTIVFFDNSYKDTQRTGDNGLETLAKVKKDANGKKIYVFAMVGHRDTTTGSVRVNDKAFEEAQENNRENIQFTVKTIAFISNREIDNINIDNWTFNSQDWEDAYYNYELADCGEQITSVCKKVTNQREIFYDDDDHSMGSYFVSDIEVYSSNGSLMYSATGCYQQDEMLCQTVNVNLEDSSEKSILEKCLLEDGLAHGTYCCPDGSMNNGQQCN